MDIGKLLHKIPCPCGKIHTCDISHIVIEPGAISRLPQQTEAYDRILLVADENTFGAAGEQVVAALPGKKLSKVVFPGDTVLIPNEAAIQTVTDALGDAQLLLGIGSGVIQDLCKYVSLTSKLPYQIVATAPSMDGYASTGAAMILGGMKVTVAAGVPEAIIADTDVLKNAPMDMILAGYGDIVGKFSALNDWKLSQAVNGEYFCQEIYDLTFRCLEKTLQLAVGLQKREEKSIRVLMEALVTVGVAMSFAGSSRPASGSEHHLSHYFEITGILRDEPYFSHGLDVAYSTVITAKLREYLLSHLWPDAPCRPEGREAHVHRIYGPVAEDCIRLQEKAGWYTKDLFSVYREKEAQLRSVLAEMPSAAQIQQMLEAVGIHMADFYRLYSAQKLADALLYAKELKDRYSVLWLAYELFGGKAVGEVTLDTGKVKVIAMDLDGTLTQHRQPLCPENRAALEALSKKYKLLMVGAGQVMRIFHQLEDFPIDIIGNYGMQYGQYCHASGEMVLKRDDVLPCDRESVAQRVALLRSKYGMEEFRGESVEFHPSGCITFPCLGTKAFSEDKLIFDPDRKKRRAIYPEVCQVFSDYTVFVGGSSSFDMAPAPYNKRYALELYCEENGLHHENIVYIGDDYGPGGNDEAVYRSDFTFLTIDDYRTFPELAGQLL